MATRSRPLSDAGSRIRGLPLVWRADARVLVLGSMPSARSIVRSQYYGHPRNAFWPILSRLLGFDRTLPYAARLGALLAARVALWDVCGECVRPGSADADIRDVRSNPIGELVERSPDLRAIALNGGKAYELFRREMSRSPDGPFDGLAILRLPSTSPAHASRTEDDKLAAWRVLLDWLPDRT